MSKKVRDKFTQAEVEEQAKSQWQFLGILQRKAALFLAPTYGGKKEKIILQRKQSFLFFLEFGAPCT